jgi:hypothetical protein
MAHDTSYVGLPRVGDYLKNIVTQARVLNNCRCRSLFISLCLLKRQFREEEQVKIKLLPDSENFFLIVVKMLCRTIKHIYDTDVGNCC